MLEMYYHVVMEAIMKLIVQTVLSISLSCHVAGFGGLDIM